MCSSVDKPDSALTIGGLRNILKRLNVSIAFISTNL
jgi:hypothetical protein